VWAHSIGALLNGVDHAECGHEFARRVHRDHELAAGGLGDVLGEGFARAENRLERFREAGCEAPADLLLGVDDGRGGAGSENAGHAGALQKFTTFHGVSFIA
jgi:hypothetical protein